MVTLAFMEWASRTGFYRMTRSTDGDVRRIEYPVISHVADGDKVLGYPNHPIDVDLVTHLHQPLIAGGGIAQERFGIASANVNGLERMAVCGYADDENCEKH
jgi:hypothetical protein